MSEQAAKSDRGVHILQRLSMPLFAFLLGRQSIAFSGSAATWFAIVCNVMVLAIALYGPIRDSRARQ